MDVYQRVFSVMSDRRGDVQDRFHRVAIKNALTDLGKTGTAQEKGDRLEELMDSVFSLKPDLEVVQRKYDLGDEEIDLVVKNNVARPFWQSLGSPLLFVECKNWSSKVGAPEVRDFESKLRNHRPMTRLGILVAPGGFTKEALEAIKRISRDSISVALVNGDDLDQLAHGSTSILDWLEYLITKQV